MGIRCKLKLSGIILGVLLLSILIQEAIVSGGVLGVFNQYAQKAELTRYEIYAEFHAEEKVITATQKLTYTNTLDKALTNLYLHIYPNAFKEKSTAPFEAEDMDNVYYNGFSPGWMEIKEIKLDNKRVSYKIMGDASTILRITPKAKIEPGEAVQLFIEFKVKLPNVLGRMGYGENTVNITNWYPIMSVFDEEGWHLDPYYPIGDPFYSDVAVYEMLFSAPEDYILASTGNVLKEKKKKDKISYSIRAENVRNFAIILSKDFQVDKGEVDGIKVLSYTLEGEKSEEALQFSVDATKIFNRLFGKYPYEQISVVSSDFFLGGMEYPNLVMISEDLYEMREDFPLEYVIAHEIAHQWWYGVVGNNEIKEPWLDEALTEYATLMYFEEKYGHHIKEQIFEKMIKAQYNNYIDFEPDKGEGILRSLREFNNSEEYSSIVYSKGAIFLSELRKEMGDEAFISALREYYRRFMFKNATTRDFYEVCSGMTEKELKPIFYEWLKIDFE